VGAAALGVVCGGTIAFGGMNGLYLCLSLLGGGLILHDFRIGVVVLIVLMPISGGHIFPHAMFGITGLNPFNLLLVATLGSCVLQGLFDGSLRRFVPPPLLWLFIVPFLLAGALGTRHVDEIVPGFYDYELINFTGITGYLRDMVAKPLLMVIFALLVGAAVSRSARPERFLIPTVLSMWVMGLMVVAFVVLSGRGIGELASAGSRSFLSSLGIHANELGRLYAVAYAMLLFTWARSGRPIVRLVLVVSMGMIIAALLLTFSRSAFAGVVIVSVLFLLWHRNVRALVFFGFLVLIALFALPDAVYDRASTGFGEGLNAITAGRLDGLWIPLIADALKNPVFGSGLGSTLWADSMRTGAGATVLPATHPHSAYLQALLDMGIAGLILLGLYFAHVWHGFRTLSEDAMVNSMSRGFYAGAAAGLFAFLIAAVMDGALTPRPEQSFLWLAIGMMYGQLGRSADEARGTE
jgi:O-antigen ligase